MDRLNAETYARHKDRPLADVLGDFHRSFNDVITYVADLPAALLIEPGYFAWTGEYALWQHIESNTNEHYEEHVLAIRAWAGSTSAV